MADIPLFTLDAENHWRLAYDRCQWVLQKRRGERAGKARYDAESFVGSSKDILWRIFRERDILLTREATLAVDAMPEHFLTWLRTHDPSAYAQTFPSEVVSRGQKARSGGYEVRGSAISPEQGAKAVSEPETRQPSTPGSVQGYGPLPDDIDMPPIPALLRRTRSEPARDRDAA